MTVQMFVVNFIAGFVIYLILYSIWGKFFGDESTPVPPNMQRSYHGDCICISGAMIDNPKCPHHGDKE